MPPSPVASYETATAEPTSVLSQLLMSKTVLPHSDNCQETKSLPVADEAISISASPVKEDPNGYLP